MRLVTLKANGVEKAGVSAEHGIVLVETINELEGFHWPTLLFEIIQSGSLDEMSDWYRGGGREKLNNFRVVKFEQALCGPLYRMPRKIWGIGHNYVDDPALLQSVEPGSEPVGFMKPDTSLIGPGDSILIPTQSERTIAEAELAIIIGRKCRDVDEEEAHRYVAGFTASLDMAADDIHEQNPRFLTRAKSFDTFFSFGPELITPDEIGDVLSLEVESVLNGEVRYRNIVSNMRYNPWFAVSFHSRVMTLLPGDVLMTGTPGAMVIRAGDVAECRISGFAPLKNPVTE